MYKSVRLLPLITIVLLLVVISVCGCFQNKAPVKAVSQAGSVPADAIKMGPETDDFAPVVHNSGWEKPVPMDSIISTAGAEDSPYMMPDGNTFYFFFTPNVSVPVEKQLIDGVTGIWWTKKVNGTWTEPERIVLCGDVSLDGCECIQGDTMWFGSVRAGNMREIDIYTAKLKNGKWTDWQNAGEQLNRQYTVGEFYVTPDGNTMYFGHEENASDDRNVWVTNRDLWKTDKINGQWGEPIRLSSNVNGPQVEDQPCLTPDGNELWFTGTSRLGYIGPAVFRCVKLPGGEWGPAEEIISNFAGEPTVDAAGNVYFVHHYYKDGKMIEADIYVARRN